METSAEVIGQVCRIGIHSLPIRDGNITTLLPVERAYSIHSLPIRDGNSASAAREITSHFIHSLPIRDGNSSINLVWR